MSDLTLRLPDRTHIVVPASLDAITTYVLLEQDAWYEREAPFVFTCLGPGATAIDIGANAGVYSLPMARRVGPSGRVYAYEPGSAARSLLEKGRRRNRAGNLSAIAFALSDQPGQGHLVFGTSSETNALGKEGAGEPVGIASLDEEDRRCDWRSPDFVKIDAQGEEHRILDGGRKFFARHSPLVMFDFKSGKRAQDDLASSFRARGYGIYRLIPGVAVLCPMAGDEAVDPYEINLFAAKPDRAAVLAREGKLVESKPAWLPDEHASAAALDLLRAQPFTPAFAATWRTVDSDYRKALAGYAVSRSPRLPAATRCGALFYAYEALLDVCRREVTLARLVTLARFACEAGERDACVKALHIFLEEFENGPVAMDEPFWPADARFDRIGLAHGRDTKSWVRTSILERLERDRAYSSLFAPPLPDLDWLARQPHASAEMERRNMLTRLRTGEHLPVPKRLLTPAPGHINADVWRNGLVPNTIGPFA